MKTAVCILAVTAVIAVAALPSRAADARELYFELVDGTVITGRIDAKAIAFRISGGSVLNIPAGDLKELTVGPNDRPGLAERVSTLIKALDSDKTRQDAMRGLIALGPSARPLVTRHYADDASPRSLAIKEVIWSYMTWGTKNPGEPKAMSPKRQPQSKMLVGESILVGTVAVEQLRITSPYGRINLKLNSIHRIRPAAIVAPVIFKRWGVGLHDKTYLCGVMSTKSTRVKTRYGTMDIPLALIRQAAFSDDGKSVRLKYWNSDRIVGTLAPETTISLKTDKGKVDLSTREIALMTHGPMTLKAHPIGVNSVAFSPDGKRLAAGSYKDTILWDTITGKELIKLNERQNRVFAVAFSPNGKRLASTNSDKTIRMWDTLAGKKLFEIKGFTSSIRNIAFSPDGKRLAAEGGKQPVSIWDSATGKKLLAFGGKLLCTQSLAFSPDGKRLAAGNLGKTVKLWDAVTGKELFTLRGHRLFITSLAFSPDGKRLASGGWGHIIKIWDTATGKELLTLKGHSERVNSVAFSPGGKQLASGSTDKTIKFWDTAAGNELHTLKGHSGDVMTVAFSPDGKRLASGSCFGVIKIWDVSHWAKPAK